jgi:hypothetical protein
MGKRVIILVSIIFILAGCWGGNGRDEITAAEIRERSEELENQFVRVPGYGVIMAEIALCPGYVGFDRRTLFVDEQEETVAALVAEGAEGEVWAYEDLKVFEGYVRVFRGEMGCPGETTWETIPYFEITAVDQGVGE